MHGGHLHRAVASEDLAALNNILNTGYEFAHIFHISAVLS